MVKDFSYPADKYVLLGKVTKAHGLQGEVKIFSFSGQPENFCGYKEIVLVDIAGNLSAPLTVEKFRVQGRTVIVQLASVTSRNLAEKIEGRGVLLAKNLLPDTTEDEYYWYQYEGKLVLDQSGQTIGRVESLFSNGAQDIMIVKSGEAEILIPITKSIIVRETAEELIVNPPPGLLDLTNESGN
jgi:16S rRNA processing protein RimM